MGYWSWQYNLNNTIISTVTYYWPLPLSLLALKDVKQVREFFILNKCHGRAIVVARPDSFWGCVGRYQSSDSICKSGIGTMYLLQGMLLLPRGIIIYFFASLFQRFPDCILVISSHSVCCLCGRRVMKGWIVWINRKFFWFLWDPRCYWRDGSDKEFPLYACCLAKRCLEFVVWGCDNCCLRFLETMVYLYLIFQSL